jgi:hypothetical protein
MDKGAPSQWLSHFCCSWCHCSTRWNCARSASLGTASRELIAALSGEVSSRDGDAPRVAERLAGEIEGFDRTLLRHLEDEEDLIIPLILERTRDDPNLR